MATLIAILIGSAYVSQTTDNSKTGKETETSSVPDKEVNPTEETKSKVTSKDQGADADGAQAKKDLEAQEKKEKEAEKLRFTREGAVAATTELIKELNVAPDGKMTLEDRMDEVSKETYDKNSIFTEKAWDSLHLTDFMATDPRGATLTAQSLLSVVHTIQDTGNKEMTPAEVDYSGVVYFDEEMKLAYVPVDLYTNAPTNLSFEMMYKDGEWVLQPYSLIAQIAIRNMDNVLAEQTPEGKETKEKTDDSTEIKDNKETTNSSVDK